jgi:hypothetical protein
MLLWCTTPRAACTPPSFEPALTEPAASDIFLVPGAATCTNLEVEVAAHAISGLFTVSFDLRYPSGILKYEGKTPGPLMRQGSPKTAPVFLVHNPEPGLLIVTLTRFARDGAATATASEALMTFHFSRAGAGSGTIDFDTGPSSTIAEKILDENGLVRPARFGPGHGGVVRAP